MPLFVQLTWDHLSVYGQAVPPSRERFLGPLHWVLIAIGLLAFAVGAWRSVVLFAGFTAQVQAPTYETPLVRSMSFGNGLHGVFEHPDPGSAGSPSAQGGQLPLDPDEVTVTGPGGTPVDTFDYPYREVIRHHGVVFNGTVGFDIDVSGTYRIAITGPRRQVSITRSMIPGLNSALSTIGLCVLVFVAAALSLTFALVRRARRRNERSGPPPGSYPYGPGAYGPGAYGPPPGSMPPPGGYGAGPDAPGGWGYPPSAPPPYRQP
jgi:hypothetical protein